MVQRVLSHESQQKASRQIHSQSPVGEIGSSLILNRTLHPVAG